MYKERRSLISNSQCMLDIQKIRTKGYKLDDFRMQQQYCETLFLKTGWIIQNMLMILKKVKWMLSLLTHICLNVPRKSKLKSNAYSNIYLGNSLNVFNTRLDGSHWWQIGITFIEGIVPKFRLSDAKCWDSSMRHLLSRQCPRGPSILLLHAMCPLTRQNYVLSAERSPRIPVH